MTDLLIVGGGPAGLTLAIMATQMGMTAGVLEAAKYPRWAHGDTLPAGIDIYFKMMGISRERLYRDAVTFSALSVHWDASVQSLPLGTSQDDVLHEGLHLPRHLLEPLLLERAQELGVPIMQPCAVKRVMVRQGRLAGVSTSQGNFQARFIVDAAGSRHWLARKLGIPVEFYSPTLHGYYNWARGECPVCAERPLIYSLPEGWSWISRVEEPDLYQCTALTWDPRPEPSRWLPREFVEAGLTPIGPTRGADMTWRVVSRPAGRGFFMLGDAVRRNDPMTNRGFELAMADACRLALLLSRWKDREIDEDEMARLYIEEVKAQYMIGLKVSRDFLSQHPQAPAWLRQQEPYFRLETLSSGQRRNPTAA